MESKVRILIAEDHPLSRAGLRQVIEAQPQYDIVGEAGDGEKALEVIRQSRPDIAILDIGMPKMDGLAVARAIQAEALEVRVIFLTMYREETLFNKALEVGAMGYVLKESATADIIHCINAVASGNNYTSPALTTYLVKQKRSPTERHAPRSGIETLTPTEHRILSMLAECKTSKEIAAGLFISPRTVDHHRANICEKLNIHGSHALIKYALDNKESLVK